MKEDVGKSKSKKYANKVRMIQRLNIGPKTNTYNTYKHTDLYTVPPLPCPSISRKCKSCGVI